MRKLDLPGLKRGELGLDELETEVTRTETRGTGRDLKKRNVEKMDEREIIRVTEDEDSRNNKRLLGRD